MSSVAVFLAEFLTPILPKIDGELTREGLIHLHRLISGNAASVALNLGGGRHGHLALTRTAYKYREQTGFTFVPPIMVNAQEQALGTENSRQKPSAVSQIHRRVRSLKKSDRHGGVTIIPIHTCGSAHRFWKGVRNHHDLTPVLQLQDNWRNRPRRERSEDDGCLQPHGTCCPIDWTIGKGDSIWSSRRTDHLRCHDGVQRDRHFGADGDL